MGADEVGRKGTISQYFTTLHCPVCDELTQLGVCSRCRAEPQRVAVTLHQHMSQWESQQDQLLKVSDGGDKFGDVTGIKFIFICACGEFSLLFLAENKYVFNGFKT